MTRDRLKELKAYSRHNDHRDSVIVFGDDLAQDIHSFLKEVEAIHDMLENIRVNTAEIKTLFGIILGMPGAHEKKNSEVAERQSIVSNTIRNVKSKLENLEISIKSAKRPAAMLYRIQMIQMNCLHEMLARMTEDYLNMLANHNERCAAIVKRQVAISNREGELDELLEKGASVFVDNIITDTLEAQIQLNFITTRHEELKKIEASILELRDLFVELALHVETQGEKMNCIRYLIEKSEAYTEQTAAKLEKARTKAIRKRRRCRKIKLALGLTATIFGLILLIIIF